MTLLIGVLVGGASRRMGGFPKGLLPSHSGQSSVLARLLEECGRALPEAPSVLVGARPEYEPLGCSMLQDEPAGIGPLGGLRALLRHARSRGDSDVLALACDLPYISAPLIYTLASHVPSSVAVIPVARGRIQPLCARYSVTATSAAVEQSLAAADYALKRMVERLPSDWIKLEIPESRAQTLDDWDSPEDIERTKRS